jgi:ornithine carbamoyltransferase
VREYLEGKDLLTFGELTTEDLNYILELSSEFKEGRKDGFGRELLKRKQFALIFEKPSTRTRVSFQVAIDELGGNALVLSSSELQLGRGETIEDTARVLSRYVHCIMARVISHSNIVKLAAYSSVPVINGLSDLYHPVQILADLMTLKEKKGKLRGLRVAWVGDGSNVCNSWLIGASLTGINFVAATPKEYQPLQEAFEKAIIISKETGSKIELTEEPTLAVKDADCVMTDTFVSMGFDKERDERLRIFLPKYQVNKDLFSQAKRDAIFMHCLPAHRGEEVTEDIIDGPSSVVFDQAENRLHTTKALLCFMMRGIERIRA